LNNSSGLQHGVHAPLWSKIVATNLNTVLATVSWELMEPEEGRFDFSLVDGVIQDARGYSLRLILLWFGKLEERQVHLPAGLGQDKPERFPLIQDENARACRP